jgi:hypothetical protein
VPTLLYGIKTWIFAKKDKCRIRADEMRVVRSAEGCTCLDRVRNDRI